MFATDELSTIDVCICGSSQLFNVAVCLCGVLPLYVENANRAPQHKVQAFFFFYVLTLESSANKANSVHRQPRLELCTGKVAWPLDGMKAKHFLTGGYEG